MDAVRLQTILKHEQTPTLPDPAPKVLERAAATGLKSRPKPHCAYCVTWEEEVQRLLLSLEP